MLNGISRLANRYCSRLDFVSNSTVSTPKLLVVESQQHRKRFSFLSFAFYDFEDPVRRERTSSWDIRESSAQVGRTYNNGPALLRSQQADERSFS